MTSFGSADVEEIAHQTEQVVSVLFDIFQRLSIGFVERVSNQKMQRLGGAKNSGDRIFNLMRDFVRQICALLDEPLRLESFVLQFPDA